MFDGLVLFYVGAVLILNGLWMLECIADREILIINLFVGLLSLSVSYQYAFGGSVGQTPDIASIRSATLSLMFAFTYLWVAYNRLTHTDGRGLGWFSLFVAVTAFVVAIQTFALPDQSTQSLISAASWLTWSVLWFMFFMLLVRHKPWTRQVGQFAIVTGICTGWLPGLWIISG